MCSEFFSRGDAVAPYETILIYRYILAGWTVMQIRSHLVIVTFRMFAKVNDFDGFLLYIVVFWARFYVHFEVR